MAQHSLLQYIDTGTLDLRQLSTPNTSSISVSSHGTTHKGKVRFVNEDAYLELTETKLWAVADGMGGHKRGDYASNAIVKALQGFSRKSAGKDHLLSLIDDLQQRLAGANEACKTAFRGKRVGSTVALLFEFGGYCFFLWAGDTRIYRLRDTQLELMTRDHSLAQEKCDKGELNHDEAREHPSAHILTRAIGVNRHLKLELRCAEAMPGDRYLLCSDGLYRGVELEKMRNTLNMESPDTALTTLITSALDSGGHDNITAIVVDLS